MLEVSSTNIPEGEGVEADANEIYEHLSLVGMEVSEGYVRPPQEQPVSDEVCLRAYETC